MKHILPQPGIPALPDADKHKVMHVGLPIPDGWK